MVNTTELSTSSANTQTGAWAGAIAQPAQDFPLTPLPILFGQVPSGLRGSLYRNGPGRLTRGAEHVGHWFDGDGAILAVHFQPEQTTATYRYVQTAGYLADEASGQFQGTGYGMHPSGSYWKRWLAPLKNAANTSVLALPDRLLALWEGGQPHALDLETLATQGLDSLDFLTDNLPYSAHPKRDPQTGAIYNFGVTFGRQPQLHLYRSDRSGTIQQHKAIHLPEVGLIHDFVLAGSYLIFCIPPIRLNLLPLLLRRQTYSEAMTWTPELGTQILVIDCESLSLVQRIEAEPWFQWHFGNGSANAAGELIINLVRYEDFATNQFLKEVATGKTQTPALGRFWQLRLDPKSGKILESGYLSDRGCEFPIVPPHQVGQPARYTYMCMHREGVAFQHELFGAIARHDAETGAWAIADCGASCYVMEPIYAPDADNPTQGWLLTVVYDAAQHRSEVWIHASDRLEAEPICRLALPQVIPFGFHGTWAAA